MFGSEDGHSSTTVSPRTGLAHIWVGEKRVLHEIDNQKVY